jgi:hypothetical protein
LANLQGGQGLACSPENTQNIELLGGDIPFLKDLIDLLRDPIVGIDEIDRGFLVFVAEFSLVYFIF